jgi:hypothetical protein
MDWDVADCVLLKATSTNCLYYRGLETMGAAAERLGRNGEARQWRERASDLRQAILARLQRSDGTFEYYVDRHGAPSGRRDALGTALTVLLRVVEGKEAVRSLEGYPVTDAGAPRLLPFWPHPFFYHNNTAWPFVDTLLIKSLETAYGVDRTDLNAALLGRTCGPVYPTDWTKLPPDGIAEEPAELEDSGTFHEVVHFPTKRVTCSGRQLWTAASFVGTCLRAGLVPGHSA